MYNLIEDLDGPVVCASEQERIINTWKIYMQKIEHETYFEQIAVPTIKKLLKQEQTLGKFSQTPAEHSL